VSPGGRLNVGGESSTRVEGIEKAVKLAAALGPRVELQLYEDSGRRRPVEVGLLSCITLPALGGLGVHFSHRMDRRNSDLLNRVLNEWSETDRLDALTFLGRPAPSLGARAQLAAVQTWHSSSTNPTLSLPHDGSTLLSTVLSEPQWRTAQVIADHARRALPKDKFEDYLASSNYNAENFLHARCAALMDSPGSTWAPAVHFLRSLDVSDETMRRMATAQAFTVGTPLHHLLVGLLIAGRKRSSATTTTAKHYADVQGFVEWLGTLSMSAEQRATLVTRPCGFAPLGRAVPLFGARVRESAPGKVRRAVERYSALQLALHLRPPQPALVAAVCGLLDDASLATPAVRAALQRPSSDGQTPLHQAAAAARDVLGV
jgi:hypothetical protein